MTETRQWTKRDQIWRVIQVFFVFLFFGIALVFVWKTQAISDWFVIIVNNSFDVPESSQLTLSIIGTVLAVMGMVISAFTAIIITNLRFSLRFRKRLGRAFMLLITLGWLAFLFLLVAIFLDGDADAAEFLSGISSGFSTEIAGAFLTVLLIDTLGRSWEEWDDESIQILESEKQVIPHESDLLKKLEERKAYYFQEAEKAKVSNSFWARLTDRTTMPVSYYEGAIAAIDSILSDLPVENRQ